MRGWGEMGRYAGLARFNRIAAGDLTAPGHETPRLFLAARPGLPVQGRSRRRTSHYPVKSLVSTTR